MRFEGTIIPGRGIGRTLGFPTLNFEIPEDFELEKGVYACKTQIPLHSLFEKPRSDQTIPLSQRGKRAERAGGFGKTPEGIWKNSILFFGKRKTFDDQLAFEVHILDEVLENSPTKAEVEILGKIRGVEKFKNEEELKKQIAEDCENARQILAVK
jgi:FAD synthase